MAKNIVVLSDGTGNSAAKVFKTNVWRVYEALDLTCPDQVARYDDGVGSASFWPLAVLGGAFGWGLKRNVLDLYMFLCQTYQHGDDPAECDRILGFGFSRGAFTIRVLNGLVVNQGLVQGAEGAELKRLASWAYRYYRRRYEARGLVRPLRWLRDTWFKTWDAVWRRPAYDPDANQRVDITFVGVWDTVDAYGLPVDEMTRGWNRWVWPLSLPDRRLSPKVKRACHALSIDDERQTFFPVLWDEAAEPQNATSTSVSAERISQVWFGGAHANVGGGYPDDTNAYTSLCWIAGEATKHQLRFMPHLCRSHAPLPDQWVERAASCGPIHDSRSGFGAYYRYAPRDIKTLSHDPINKVRIPRVKIHESVFERIYNTANEYAPIVLPVDYAIVKRGGQILEGDFDAVPGPAAPNPYEHSTQAKNRAHIQAEIWNLVWRRRVVYFATVLVTLLLVTWPLCPARDRIGILSEGIQPLSALIRTLGGLTPALVSRWVAHYQTYPLQLFMGGLVVVGLLWRAASLEQKITDRMRKAWLNGGGRAAIASTTVPGPRGLLYRFRTSRRVLRFTNLVAETLWPNLFGFSMLMLLIWGVPVVATRLAFEVTSDTGGICRSSGTVSPVATQPFWLRSNELCQATGLAIERGIKYKVAITMPPVLESDPGENEPFRPGRASGVWMDRTIRVESPAGFSSRRNALLFYPLVPLRRVVTADWFVPVARVGSKGDEEYPLASPNTEFTAERSGELFLFVNDAVLPCPRWNCFYSNNTGGAASVRVTKLDAGAVTTTKAQ